MFKKYCYMKELSAEVAKVRPDWTVKKCEEAVRATAEGIESAILAGYDAINIYRLFTLTLKERPLRKGHPFNNPNLKFLGRKTLGVKTHKNLFNILTEIKAKEDKAKEDIAKGK